MAPFASQTRDCEGETGNAPLLYLVLVSLCWKPAVSSSGKVKTQTERCTQGHRERQQNWEQNPHLLLPKPQTFPSAFPTGVPACAILGCLLHQDRGRLWDRHGFACWLPAKKMTLTSLEKVQVPQVSLVLQATRETQPAGLDLCFPNFPHNPLHWNPRNLCVKVHT
ncbi:uncharacterized protein RBU33_006482 isoform 1-T1 [Hipposideros larvatus]